MWISKKLVEQITNELEKVKIQLNDLERDIKSCHNCGVLVTTYDYRTKRVELHRRPPNLHLNSLEYYTPTIQYYCSWCAPEYDYVTWKGSERVCMKREEVEVECCDD
jgi:hypothetical protein